MLTCILHCGCIRLHQLNDVWELFAANMTEIVGLFAQYLLKTVFRYNAHL